jgi:hypothetical protein
VPDKGDIKRFLPWWADETGRKNTMRILIALATITATPALAHTSGALHVPHVSWLVIVGVGVLVLAAYNAIRR